MKSPEQLAEEYCFQNGYDRQSELATKSFIGGYNKACEHRYKWIPVSERLPKPANFAKSCNIIYDVRTKEYGTLQAMFCVHPEFGTRWFKDYTALLIIPVLEWKEIL